MKSRDGINTVRNKFIVFIEFIGFIGFVWSVSSILSVPSNGARSVVMRGRLNG